MNQNDLKKCQTAICTTQYISQKQSNNSFKNSSFNNSNSSFKIVKTYCCK